MMQVVSMQRCKATQKVGDMMVGCGVFSKAASVRGTYQRFSLGARAWAGSRVQAVIVADVFDLSRGCMLECGVLCMKEQWCSLLASGRFCGTHMHLPRACRFSCLAHGGHSQPMS